jgi:iron complex outermembrane receptor protein
MKKFSLCSIGWLFIAGPGAGVAAAVAAAGVAGAGELASSAEAGADTDSSGHALAEVIVTARKRDEPLQTVPVAVSVVSDADLRATYTSSLVDITSSTPDVVFHTVGEFGHSSSLSIRGVGGGGANLDTDPAVAIYVDGQYQTVNAINLESLVGIESIEVLRGPQGTLFGRNAFAGAIDVTTKNPSGQLDATTEVTLGNYGRKNLEAAVDFPLSPAGPQSLSGRVDLAWINSDGFYTNVLDHDRSIGGDANLTIRPTLLFTAADNLKVQFKYNFVDDQSDPTPNKYDLDPPASGYAILDPGEYANWGNTHLGPEGTQGPYSAGFTNLCTCNFIEINSPSLRTDYDSGLGRLTAITGYQHVQGDIETDATGTAVPLLLTSMPYTIGVVTQELRLLSQVTSRFKLITGLYYLQDTLDESFLEFIRLGPSESTTWKDSTQHRRSRAAFTEGEYSVAEGLRLTVGARYTDESKDFRFGAAVPVTVSHGSAVLPTSYDYTPLGATWHNLSPKVSLDYRWTDTMAYVTWSRGFKAGGFQALASTASEAGPYGDETMDATEVGIKSSWQRVRLSADVFYESIYGLQRSVVFLVDGISNNLTLNAANSASKGFEMEGAFLPTDALTVVGNVGYLDSYYTSFCANFVATNENRPGCGRESGAVDNTNLALSNAPRWTVSASADYRLAAGDVGTVDFHVDEAYTTSLWTADDNSPISYRAPDALLNAAIKFSRGARYAVSLWARNLTDRTVTEAGVTAYPLFSLWNPTPPRTFGVTLSIDVGRGLH